MAARNGCSLDHMLHALFAFSYIDWMSPLTHSFILLKLLLLPVAAVYGLRQRSKLKKSGIPPHESAESRKPREMWVNHSLHHDSETPPSEQQPPSS